MRDSMTQMVSLLAAERWTLLLLVFHVSGVHALASARAWWMKAVGFVFLLAAVPCWINAIGIQPSSLGLNAQTMGAGAGAVLVAGLWLFLAGRGALEWLSGFGICALAGATALFASGQRWPAVACVFLFVPLLGAVYCCAQWPLPSRRSGEGSVDPVLSAIAILVSGAVLTIAIGDREGFPSTAPEQAPRLRDFVTQPAILVLLGAGGLFGAMAAVRLWPAERLE